MKTKGWMGTVALAALLGATGCSKNEGDGGGGGGSSNASKLEEYAMTPEWINYATAVSSELLDDCVGLWASWNGPSGIPDEDWNRIGRDFFSKNTIVGADGYAQYMRTASEGNDKFTSGVDAIRTILVDGFANISNEVGSSKIGNPNSLALSGQTNEAVLQVESWYSWNSITDYSDNIISIKNGYAGRRGAIGDPADANSISAYVKSQDADLDARMTAAIDGAYNAIKSMQAPFRNNLTGSKVDAAITACSDLTELTEGSLLGLFENAGDYDFTAILTQYADLQGSQGKGMGTLQRDGRPASRQPEPEQGRRRLHGVENDARALGTERGRAVRPCRRRDGARLRPVDGQLAAGPGGHRHDHNQQEPVERRRLHRSDRQRIGPRLPYHRAVAVQRRAEPKGARRMKISPARE